MTATWKSIRGEEKARKTKVNAAAAILLRFIQFERKLNLTIHSLIQTLA